MASPLRFTVLAVVLAAALAALAWRVALAPATPVAPTALAPAGGTGTLGWAATAHQLGVVGYRDPPGALSPDGRTLAYGEGRDVRITPVDGGAVVTVARATGQVRSLGWAGDEALVFEDTTATPRWWRVPRDGGDARPLWPDALEVRSGDATLRPSTLRGVTVSTDGRTAAGLVPEPGGAALWRLSLVDGAAVRTPVPPATSSPAFLPGGGLACVVRDGARTRLSVPCGGSSLHLIPDVDVVGPIAFSPTGDALYFASPNTRGFVDLWRADLDTRRATRLTGFARDTYAPTIAADGTVLFRVQSYRTHVAELTLDGSAPPRQLATFQSETPSYHPDGRTVAVTYGTWRRVLDDAHYPDIAQEIGLLRAGDRTAPQDAPVEVIARSDSEDQAMAWSPNGRWIAFHSHREQSDDVWLRPADGSQPDRRISFLGRGAEVGWPRWSPDGATVAFGGANPRDGRGAIFTIAVDQETGAAGQAREVAVDGVDADWTSAEWLPDSRTLAVLGKAGPGTHVIATVPVTGGRATVVRRIDTEHDFPGLAVSPDGREVAFVQRADDGWFQVFRMRLDGSGAPVRLTYDAGHKSQPAWAPDGRRLAYTVWSYDAQFWAWRPSR